MVQFNSPTPLQPTVKQSAAWAQTPQSPSPVAALPTTPPAAAQPAAVLLLQAALTWAGQGACTGRTTETAPQAEA